MPAAPIAGRTAEAPVFRATGLTKVYRMGEVEVPALRGVDLELGYDARIGPDAGGMPTIEADNCIFHELAMKNPEVCRFDLALLSGFSGSKAELTECMARGGHVCRFRFSPPG
jgi:predicted ArsR family transcriptional regulator